MKIIVALAVASFAPSANALVKLHDQGFLSGGMQPDRVAKTLGKVAESWKAQAHVFAECKAGVATDIVSDCTQARNAFHASCAKVTGSVVQASSGNTGNLEEYMNDVQKYMSGWHQKICKSLTLAVTSRMSASDVDNRDNFKADKSCDSVWSELEKEAIAQEKAEELQEKKEREAEIAEQKAREKREAEEAKKKAEEAKKAAALEAKKAAAKAEEQKREKAAEEARKAAAVALAAKEKAAAKAEEAKKLAQEAKKAAEEKKAKEEPKKLAQEPKEKKAAEAPKKREMTKEEMKKQQEAAKVLNKALKGLR